MNRFVRKMDKERQMAIDNVGSIRMTLNKYEGDFESCKEGYSHGQALCGLDLDLFFAVSEAEEIEVIPYKRPGKNRVKIEPKSFCSILIDSEQWSLYVGTARTANHWIDKGYRYVGIEVIR